ncbi:type II toxin-antitoxin system YoeB family toxin [Streptomyces sp. NPDC093149]
MGGPELPKHGFQGFRSRRITDEHRVIHEVVDEKVRIAACRNHYGR